MSIRVRFAPSPTGHLHVGGARTALFNWLVARNQGGAFILRIEDTDRDRSSEEMVEGILRNLEWLGLDWDEGPFLQSEGLSRHAADVEALLHRGLAYRDFTSADELAGIRKEDPARAVRYPREQADRLSPGEADERALAGQAHAVRFRISPGETSWNDQVHGQTRFRNGDIEDLVLLRTDGTPTYNLAVASDDADMRITHVVRGDDHISNTPKQILLLQSLERPVPIFAHVPMILGPDGKRLSKRHGANSVSDYRAEGILPDAMANFLALLGWSPGTDEEVMSREVLTERFSLGRVLKKSAVFDPTKLEWLNGQHLSRIPAHALVEEVLAALGHTRSEAEKRLDEDRTWFLGLLDLLKVRARTAADIATQARVFLEESLTPEPEAVDRYWSKDPETARDLLASLAKQLEGVPWAEKELEGVVRGLAGERGIGAGRLIHPLRVAVTGQAVSPGLFEVLRFLGRDLTLSRIRDAVRRLEKMPAPPA